MITTKTNWSIMCCFFFFFLFFNSIVCVSQNPDSVIVSNRLKKILILQESDYHFGGSRLYKCYDYNIPYNDEIYLISVDTVYRVIEFQDTIGCDLCFEKPFCILNTYTKDGFFDSLGFTSKALKMGYAAIGFDILDTKQSQVSSECYQPDYYISNFVMTAKFNEQIVTIDTLLFSSKEKSNIKNMIIENSYLAIPVKVVTFENETLFIIDIGVYLGERTECIESDDGMLYSITIGSQRSIDKVVESMNNH